MNMASLFPRRIEPRIAEAMLDTPVVLLAGRRQAGRQRWCGKLQNNKDCAT